MPYLAASPDRLIASDGIIEVKCPFSARNEVVNPETVGYVVKDNHGICKLDKSHDYCYQVQGILMCTHMQWCDFVIWIFNDPKVMQIVRNDEFIRAMTDRLSSFYAVYFKPAILQKFYYRQPN